MKKNSATSTDVAVVFAPLERLEEWETWREDADSDLALCLDGTTGELGPYIRWLVALRLLLQLLYPEHRQMPWQGFQATLPARAMKALRDFVVGHAAGHEAVIMKADFNSAFRRDKNQWKLPGKYLAGRVLELVLEALNRKLSKPVPITSHAFLAVRNGSARGLSPRQMIQRFEQWLEHDIHGPADDLAELQCELLLTGSDGVRRDGRGDQLRRIATHLSEPQSDHQPVINIYAPSNRTGLRALATRVLYDQHRLRSDPAGSAVAPKLVYIPICEDSDGRPRSTRSTVLRKLRNCFSMDQPSDEGPHGAPNLAREVAELRRALSIYPTLIVFDAVEINGGPNGAILDYIQDAHWEDFLRALIQPDHKEMRRLDRPYPSRFVVLSNRALSGLKPWTVMQEGFKPPAFEGASRRLLEEPESVEPELEEQRRQLNAMTRGGGLHRVYTRDKSKLDLMFLSPAFAGAPTEGDLTFAGLLPEDDLRDVVVRSVHALVDRRVLRSRLVHCWLDLHAGSDDKTCVLVLVLMVVASVDGLRITTLARSVARWLQLIPAESRAAAARMERMVRECSEVNPIERSRLFKAFPGLLVHRVEEAAPTQEDTQRRFELVDTELFAANDVVGMLDRRLVDIRLTDVRQLVHDTLSAPASAPHPDQTARTARGKLQEPSWLGMDRGRLWATINQAIGEEAMRQATSQLRHMDSRALSSPHVHRRMVQTIYHGLLSYGHDAGGDLGPDERADQDPGTPSLEAAKRFRLLYTLLMRDCVEDAPHWALGRGLARSELRFQLLRMFLAPVLSDPMNLAPPGSRQERINLQRELEHRRDIHERDSAVYLDLLEALGRSAYDTGRHSIVELLVKEAERVLKARPLPAALDRSPGVGNLDDAAWHLMAIDRELHQLEATAAQVRQWVERANAGVGRKMPQFAREHFSFLKLRIDSLQSRRLLDDAQRACLKWLDHHAPELPDLSLIGNGFRMPSGEDAVSSSAKREFDAILRNHVDEAFRRYGSDNRMLEAMADILSRLGEILATRADSRSDWRDARPEFLNAYGVYWIADRLRSGAVEFGDLLRWPKVSARPMRYYIRVSLKIARIMADNARPGSAAWCCSREFFAHARDRLDVYSRHLFRSPRERLAMLLLLAACARVWHEIQGEAAAAAPGVHEAPRLHDSLLASLAYVREAESLALELGLPKVVSYRVFFERIKTVRRLIEAAGPDDSALRRLWAMDLGVLDRLSEGNPFWAELVTRQRKAERPGAEAARLARRRPVLPASSPLDSTDTILRLLGPAVGS